MQSLGTLIGRTGRIGYFLSNISHLLWIFFTIGTLLGCLFFLLFRQYSFVWETTILSANFFVWFTGFVGSFPCITDFYAPCPSAADITSLADQDETRKAWTKWLLGSIVVYGLMPRILAFFVSLNISKRTVDRLVIESTNPFYNLLAKRLRDRISLYEEIIDPDPGNVTPTGNLKSKTDQFLPTKNIGMIIPFEVRNLPDIDLAPCDTKPIQATNVRTHIEKQHALQLLAKSSVSNLLIIADAGVTADRGAFHFIHQAMGNAANIRVALLQQNDARQDKVENWLEGLNEIGINRQSIFPDMEPALCWLLNKNS